jgi:hypothetical protein
MRSASRSYSKKLQSAKQGQKPSGLDSRSSWSRSSTRRKLKRRKRRRKSLNKKESRRPHEMLCLRSMRLTRTLQL